QALFEMQDRERVQDFHRGGKNQRREEALLYGRAASRKPPGREQQCHETNGKPEGFRFRQFLPNTELTESNHERQQRDEADCENEEAKHGYEMEYWSGGAMECWDNGVMERAIAGCVVMTPTLQHSDTPSFRSSFTPATPSPAQRL